MGSMLIKINYFRLLYEDILQILLGEVYIWVAVQFESGAPFGSDPALHCI